LQSEATYSYLVSNGGCLVLTKEMDSHKMKDPDSHHLKFWQEVANHAIRRS